MRLQLRQKGILGVHEETDTEASSAKMHETELNFHGFKLN